MADDIEEKPQQPLGRREIRGLTVEELLKYGALIVSMIWGFYLLKSKVDENAKANDINEKRIEVLETRQNTNDIWKAHTEEQLKNIK